MAIRALRTVSGEGALRSPAAAADTEVNRAQAAKTTARRVRAGHVRL